MKNNIFLFIIVLFLFSCTKHQFVFFDGNTRTDEVNNFVAEQDSVQITYKFDQENGFFNTQVYNNSVDTSYVDWENSFILIGDQRIAYLIPDNEPNTHQYLDQNSGQIRYLTMVPPGAKTENQVFCVTDFFPGKYPASNRQRVKVKGTSGTLSVKRYMFTDKNSPVWFQNTLAIADKERVPVKLESEFWIHKVFESTARELYFIEGKEPRSFYSMDNNLGNCVHTTGVTNYGTAVVTVGIGAVLAGVVLLELNEEEED